MKWLSLATAIEKEGEFRETLRASATTTLSEAGDNMPAKKILDEYQKHQLIMAFYSDEPMTDVMKRLGHAYQVVSRYWKEMFGEPQIKARHARLSAQSKKGSLNPMYGLTQGLHPRAKDKTVNSLGYVEIWAPDWYTGPADNGRAYEHIVVWCEEAGYTELPKGCVVHHLDHSRDNNRPDNLLLMTLSDHMAYHNTKNPERATTILKRSREKALPKRLPS